MNRLNLVVQRPWIEKHEERHFMCSDLSFFLDNIVSSSFPYLPAQVKGNFKLVSDIFIFNCEQIAPGGMTLTGFL